MPKEPRTSGGRDWVASELRRLVSDKLLAQPAGTLLADLADSLQGTGVPIAPGGWADIDLVGTFGRAEAFVPDADAAAGRRSPRFRRKLIVLEILQGIFVFVPLLITWFCLQQAADAYHDMLTDRATSAAARAGNFLELWQTGFGGKLFGPLKFEWAALYTLIAIILLIAITVAAAELRRRADAVDDEDDLARDAVRRDLMAVLAWAQLIVNQDRLASPAKFAGDLAAAAESLRVLLTKADETQRATLAVAGRYDATARELTAAVRALHGASTDMTVVAAQVQAAATGMEQSGRDLSADIRTRVTAAAERLEGATEAARLELTDQRETGRATLERLDRQLTATLGQVAEQIGAATTRLAQAGDEQARVIQESGEEAAGHIGQTYQEAVLAGTTDLRLAILAATAATQEAVVAAVTPLVDETRILIGAIERAREGAAERAAHAARASEEQIAALRDSSGNVSAAAVRNESVLDQHAGVLREHAQALKDMADRLSSSADETTARQETALGSHSGALRENALALRDMADRVSSSVGEATGQQEAALGSHSEALRGHAQAFSDMTDRVNGSAEGVLGRQEAALGSHSEALRDMADRLSGSADANARRQEEALGRHASMLADQADATQDATGRAASAAGREALALRDAVERLIAVLGQLADREARRPAWDAAEEISANGGQAVSAEAREADDDGEESR